MPRARGIIYVVGPHSLQNELVSAWLEREVGVKCSLVPDIWHVRLLDHTELNGEPSLLLLDCGQEDSRSILAILDSCSRNEWLAHCSVALFNACHDLGVEQECVSLGVHGFFYANDTLAQFLKGIRAILRGESWLSRELMTRCILGNSGRQNASKTDTPILSWREREILVELAAGPTNREIADKLYISVHTVKSHLYNIYKKIDVRTRLQAAIWAQKNV